MTVGELINELSKFQSDTNVVLGNSGEGFDFTGLREYKGEDMGDGEWKFSETGTSLVALFSVVDF